MWHLIAIVWMIAGILAILRLFSDWRWLVLALIVAAFLMNGATILVGGLVGLGH